MSKKFERNDPCPCGSGKKYKVCCISLRASEMPVTWSDGENTRIILKGEKPTQDELDKLTREYQKQIKASPFWDDMVKQYGEEKAEEILSTFKAELN